MPTRLQADLITILWHAAFWTVVAFIPVVSLAWKWWEHQFGRALMSVNVLLAVAFLPGELQLLFSIRLSLWVTIGVIAAIPLRTVWLAAAIIRIQVRARRRKAAQQASQSSRSQGANSIP